MGHLADSTEWRGILFWCGKSFALFCLTESAWIEKRETENIVRINVTLTCCNIQTLEVLHSVQSGSVIIKSSVNVELSSKHSGLRTE